MTETIASDLRKTPLHARHCASNARMVPFGGWDMPVEYSASRRSTSPFVRAPASSTSANMAKSRLRARARWRPCSASRATTRAACRWGRPTLGTHDLRRHVVDDMLVYRMAPGHFLLVVNASNIAKDYAWIAAQVAEAGEAAAVDSSSRYALIAIQGPAALGVVQPLCSTELAGVKYYWFTHGKWPARARLISRTGYTARTLRDLRAAEHGRSRVAGAARVGARRGCDPVRPRRARHAPPRGGHAACTATTSTNDDPLEADLGDRRGRRSRHRPRAAARAEGERDHAELVGFEMIDRGIARHGLPVLRDGKRWAS